MHKCGYQQRGYSSTISLPRTGCHNWWQCEEQEANRKAVQIYMPLERGPERG